MIRLDLIVKSLLPITKSRSYQSSRLNRGCFSCNLVDYKDVKLKASIIIIYHNEAYSVLIRMLDSIFERTPSNLLHEIILYNDASIPEHTIQKDIEDYARYVGWDKIKYLNSVERQGLIRAKVWLLLLPKSEFVDLDICGKRSDWRCFDLFG